MTRTPSQIIIEGAAIDIVISIATIDRAAPSVKTEQIFACQPTDLVHSTIAMDGVIPIATENDVIATRAVDNTSPRDGDRAPEAGCGGHWFGDEQ